MIAITAGMFILFMKKKWILAGRDESIIDKMGKDDRHHIDKKTTSATIESFESFISGKKKSDDDKKNSNEKYSSASDKVAKKTADKIRDSESE